jgi:uncharacterized protein YbjT (DUF2867 family)
MQAKPHDLSPRNEASPAGGRPPSGQTEARRGAPDSRRIDDPILVCGAAGGTQGSTGLIVTRLLRERGVAVRALVHRLDQRSEALRALGAEVVQADLLDLASVDAAMAGVRRAYFTYPVRDGLLEATAIFAGAACEAGVEQVINLSQLLRRADLPTPRQRQHWLSEIIFN